MPMEVGIGLTASQPNQPLIFTASIPVTALDADCTETLGLPTVALLLALLPPGQKISWEAASIL